MSFFRKSSGNEAKSATLGSVSRQNVIQDTNKRRSLLQDNSWIKNRPTEEENKSKDENFGKNILSHYKSQDNLDRPAEDEGTNRIHNRFKSDDALDSDKSEYENKRQSWTPGSRTTATTTSTEDKRKSWTPLNKSTITTTETKHINQPTDKSTTASWIDSAKTRNQNIEHIEVSNTKIKSTKGTDELDNFIDIKPSTIKEKPRTDELDKLIDIKPSATKAKPRTDELDKLIDIKPSATKAKPRTDELDNLIDIKPSAIKAKPRTDDLNNLIDIKPSAVKGKTRTDDLNNLIDIKPSAVKGKTSSNTILKEEDLDDFIQVERDAKNIRSRDEDANNLIESKKPESKPRDQGLDDLIAITGDTNKGTVKPTSTNTSNVTSRSSTTSSYVFNEDNQSAPSRNSTTTYTVTEDTHNVPNRRSTTTTRVTESTDAGSRRSASYNVSDNSDAPNQRSNVGYSQETSYSSPPTNTYVYKTSFEDSRSYQSNSAANSIKTVYSTSDRSVIEKDMCTFCRKILGIDAKMILKDLSISCHASCFKCEVCNGDLGGMRAGDSMWIYKQAIHCEPCYFAAREKWII
ncbi:sciellin isoform X11 [Xenopus laevis]|uniref:Sciellin isoform X11 n=1 Tax=Xenopus laevis TaxID=8355 RepID=A0A8J1MFD1_XENLA|nr:sciellin isoform X11 [Xenopus laevis]